MLLQRPHAHGIKLGKGKYGFVRAAARLLGIVLFGWFVWFPVVLTIGNEHDDNHCHSGTDGNYK